ncbi:cytochrome c oxidase assembly factor 3, mitochondrial [Atheta coriaria]|uniref:cytochrome c oxidase assembly factor 3, mitochondrial n=1 Tax=Dalotia coriaria TaxID=877792 RepID=UPI0031F36FAB
MSDKERMPSVDFSKLKQSDLNFIKLVEKQNRERVEKLKRIRRNNNITGAIIGCGVLGIYFYSMYAVRQERFLDDFDEPIKIVEKQ